MVRCQLFVIRDFLNAMCGWSLAWFTYFLSGQHGSVNCSLTVSDKRLEKCLQIGYRINVQATFDRKFEGTLLVFSELEFILGLEKLFVKLICIIHIQLARNR